MNDRYLYRAKRTDNGEWVEGQLIIIAKVNYYICTGKLKAETIKTAQIIPQMYKIDEDTICQCTGKLDNTRTKEFPEGKLIFEHDIVGFLDTYSTESGYAEQDCIGEVLWDDEELCFYVTERLSAESYEVLDDCKIIGNRFDNPELLEV